MTETRPSIAAGNLYNSDKHELLAQVDSYIDTNSTNTRTQSGVELSGKSIKSIIVPHSGYEYTGNLMGKAYSRLKDQEIDEAFILGVAHFSKIDTTAIATFENWETPLGNIKQSPRTGGIIKSDDLQKKDILQGQNQQHLGEHSIEVQLPFLQYLKKKTKIVPILVGDESPRLLANVLLEVLDKNDLVIASVEFSQNFPKDYAEVIDATAIDAILDLDTDRVMDERYQVTNRSIIGTIIELAKAKDWQVGVLDYENSSIVDHKEDRTVGRAAIVFYE